MKGSNRYLCCMALIIRATLGGGRLFTPERQELGGQREKSLCFEINWGRRPDWGNNTIGGTKAVLFVSFPQSHHGAGWEVGSEVGMGWMGSGK
jgi:hypothetical protein